MKIELLKPDQISDRDWSIWSALQRADPALGNPSFCPEFTVAASRVRKDIEVAVIHQEDGPVGFFPFERHPGNVGFPVASAVTDMHGLIVDRDTPWEPLELLSASRLVAWKFDHLVASQTAFSPYVRSLDDSYYMDLESGFETYLRERTAASASLKRAASKARKIEREVGPMRFSLENQQREAFEQMLEWKREQLRLMQQVDVYRIDWVREFLERIWTTRTGGFEGLLSTLHAGDQLIAVQLGMRSGPVVSAWIPTFNSKFARYSPGMLLHLELAKRAAKLGVTRIDLGRGENQLKRSLMSGTIPVALGSVDRRFFHRLLTTGWYQLRDLAPQIPGGGLAHRLYRRGRRLIG